MKNQIIWQILLKNEWWSTFSCDDVIYKVPVGGEHFIYNALASIAVGKYFKVSDEDIKAGILNLN